MTAPSPKEQDRKASPDAITPTATDATSQPTIPNGLFTEPPIPEPLSAVPTNIEPEAVVGSPFKKQRSSLPGFDENVRKKLGLDAVAGNARRESESSASGSTVFPSGAGTSWPTGLPEPSTKTFHAGGSATKPEASQEMEEEL
jgi:hypothetical protein